MLILDYGTALTFDYISKKGIFEGGLIIPGPAVSLEALCTKAALLPKVEFPHRKMGGRHPFPLIGRDTSTGLRAGILQGYGALTDGLVKKFHRSYDPKIRVIATGGFAPAIFPYTRMVDKLDPLLTLKSLVEVYRDFCS